MIIANHIPKLIMRSAYNLATKMLNKRKAVMAPCGFHANKEMMTDINVDILKLLYYKIQILLIVISSNTVMYNYYYTHFCSNNISYFV